MRSIQQVHADLSLSFYCAVENGIVLTAMSPGRCCPICSSLFAGLAAAPRSAAADHRLRLLPAPPGDGGRWRPRAVGQRCCVEQRVIGFNTYGEQFNGMHINQTFTGVAIGRPVGRAER